MHSSIIGLAKNLSDIETAALALVHVSQPIFAVKVQPSSGGRGDSRFVLLGPFASQTSNKIPHVRYGKALSADRGYELSSATIVPSHLPQDIHLTGPENWVPGMLVATNDQLWMIVAAEGSTTFFNISTGELNSNPGVPGDGWVWFSCWRIFCKPLDNWIEVFKFELRPAAG